MSIIFFDIDGTVMDLDGTIPPSAVTAVRRLHQAVSWLMNTCLFCSRLNL